MYNLSDPNEPMVDKKCICHFHWTQSMDRHSKQQINQSCMNDIRHCVTNTRLPHCWKKLMFSMWPFIVGGNPQGLLMIWTSKVGELD